MLPLKMKKLLLHIPIIIGSIIMLYPLIWLLFSSFKLPHHIFTDVGLFSEEYTLANYARGWAGVAGTPFYVFFKNSFVIALLAIVGNVVSCSMAAYAFARLEFRFKNIMFALMLMTMMLPYHVVIIPQYIMFNHLDWVNTFAPLTVPKFLATEGFFVFLLVQFMRNLPKELDQAATVDGCGPIQTFWRLIMPLSLPAIVTTSIFTFIWIWNDFFSQLIYLSDVDKLTVALGLRLFLDSTSESQWGSMFAMAILSLLPIFVVFIFFQRYLIEGITAGGVKG